MNLYKIVFSPTGGTMKAADNLAHPFTCRVSDVDVTKRTASADWLELTEDDIVILAAPVYAGRIPALCAEKFRAVKGNNARCIVLAVYGNRAYDDALVELADIAKETGMRVIAGVAAVAEHSVLRRAAQGRPDWRDEEQMTEFGKKIIAKIESDSPVIAALPGNRPYRKGMAVGTPPLTAASCTACRVCSFFCPAGALELTENGLHDIEGKCIGCMKCMAVCPENARYLPEERVTAMENMLKEAIEVRKENELFL